MHSDYVFRTDYKNPSPILLREGFINSWSFLPAPRTPFSQHQPNTAVWAVGFLFGNTELSLELWEFISVVARFDS